MFIEVLVAGVSISVAMSVPTTFVAQKPEPRLIKCGATIAFPMSKSAEVQLTKHVVMPSGKSDTA